MKIKMTAVEIKEVAKKYHLLPKSLKVQAYIMFEQGLEPAKIVYQNLLPGLRKVTIHSYYSEWRQRRK